MRCLGPRYIFFLFVLLVLLILPPQTDKWAQMTRPERALGYVFCFVYFLPLPTIAPHCILHGVLIFIFIINYFSFVYRYVSHQWPISYHQHQHLNPIASHRPNIDLKQWPPKPDLTIRNPIVTAIQPNRHPKHANMLDRH